MLNRRHLRAKVLQMLYAYHLSDDKQFSTFQKALLKSADEVYEMYIWILSLLDEVSAYTLVDAEDSANKHLPSEDDLNKNIRLNHNTFIESLRLNEEYIEMKKKYKTAHVFDPEVVRDIFQMLKKSPEYEFYIKSSDISIQTEKDIIKYIFKTIILKTPGIEQVFEEKFINWPIDKEVLKAMMAKTFKNFNSENPKNNKLAELSPNWVDDREFMVELFKLTLAHSEEYQSMISKKAKNWEAERVALVDTLLMRMAICEMLNFSSIPVKVTINEYIEISKEFSTAKSNLFINGILDKVLADLKMSGRIHKFGRGLSQ
ncbi:NusB antitermination factor [bacterium A37T11]|nr:NusB antitermination factor [bacterium A37T11]